MQPKAIGINDLIEEGKGPIWVLNTTNNLYKTGADVFVTFNNNGQSSIMQVSRTWLPIEVTARFPRKIVLESPYFTDALNKGMLQAISVADATKILAQPGAAREAARLRDLEEAVKEATAARGIGKNVMVSTGDLDRDAELQSDYEKSNQKFVVNASKANGPDSINLGNDEEEEEDPISANFKAWVIRLNEISDEDEARNEVKLRGSMSLEEAEYLMKKIVHNNISSYIAKRLKKINKED